MLNLILYQITILRNSIYFSILVFLFLFKGLRGYAQTPHNSFIFKQFIDNKGTLSNIVNTFLEDTDGFLWIGTSGGLKRFDGRDFVFFQHEKGNPNSLPHSVVQSLCEDKSGKIWIGTGEGVGYFDKKINQFFILKEFNKSEFVCFNILCDDKGDIWFSIRGRGLYHYSQETKKIDNFVNDPYDKSTLSNNWIDRAGLVRDPLNRGLWMETDIGVNFYDFSKKQFFNRDNNPDKNPIFESKNVRCLAIDNNYLILSDIDAHAVRYYDVTKEQVVKEIPLKSITQNNQGEIRYIFVDRQHNLWLSDLFDYCYYYNIETQRTFQLINDTSKPTSIASNSFWSTYQHKDGSIWLGTNDGISITNPMHNFYEMYDLGLLYPKLKNENQLYLFVEDVSDDTWWVAATANSFIHYYPKTNQLEAFEFPPLPTQTIQALIDHQHLLYVIASKSFYVFDKKTKKSTKISLPENLIKAGNRVSHAIQKDDAIWFFSNNTYTYSYHFTTKKWNYYPILTHNLMNISCSAVDNNGDMWIAVPTQGLAKFSKMKQAFEMVTIPNDQDFKKIWHYTIEKDKMGNFWIGSYYNVVKFNPVTRQLIEDLDINVTADLYVDKEDNIWTAVYNDFNVYFPKIKRTISESIPISKGNFNLNWRNSFYSLRNGKIVSLIKSNVVIINPNKLILTSTKDKVLISKITLANQEVLLHNASSFINLASSENGFGVYFSTLDPPYKHTYKFSYQLSGYNENWVSTPNNSASFSNLDGGDYVFKVRGIDNNGYETPISILNIHIDTIFYKSKWFLFFCTVLVGILLYAFVRYRANQRSKIYHLKVQSTRLEKDKTEIQYQNLINHLNPHFLFNSLTSLNSLIMTEPKQASKFLQKLSLIYRYILQNKEKDVVSLEQEISFVKHYIDLQKSRFEEGLQINIDIDNEHLTSRIVPVTLQNLFENAIKHNTIEEESPLIITVLVEDDYLLIKNNLQRKKFVETSNKQGLESLKNLYKYLTSKPLETIETETHFLVKIPLL